MMSDEGRAGANRAEVPDVDAPSATMLAIRNAFKLGGSLLFTWGIALAIRLLLPRYLGPTLFGTLNFADAFTTTFFITLSLGADTYIRKEVAVRPSHASDFFGGTFALRTVMTAGIFGAMAIVMRVADRPPDVRQLVYLYALTQYFVNANATLSAMLHAKGRVGGMSVLAVATKVIWAAGVLAAMATHAGLWAFAVAYLASESVETVALYRLAQTHLGLKFRIDAAATKAMLVGSLPYYLNTFATTAYGKLDVSLLEFAGNGQEVGWYGAANAVAGLTLLITPLIGWVLMPMFARAAARSREELYEQICRSMELILTVAIPASLLINLGAPFWIRVIFGAAFAPAAPALRVLATMFVLTYVAIVQAITLMMLERAWTLTVISMAGLVVNAVLNLCFIRFSMRTFGLGGGGTGCALAMLATEIFVTSCMMVVVGRGAFDRRSLGAIGKSLAACAVVGGVHHFLASLGPARLAIDLAVYLALVLATGGLRLKEMVGVAREAVRSHET
jgi:O-antigen/teichoic acid export membrane protein